MFLIRLKNVYTKQVEEEASKAVCFLFCQIWAEICSMPESLTVCVCGWLVDAATFVCMLWMCRYLWCGCIIYTSICLASQEDKGKSDWSYYFAFLLLRTCLTDYPSLEWKFPVKTFTFRWTHSPRYYFHYCYYW